MDRPVPTYTCVAEGCPLYGQKRFVPHAHEWDAEGYLVAHAISQAPPPPPTPYDISYSIDPRPDPEQSQGTPCSRGCAIACSAGVALLTAITILLGRGCG